MCPITAAVDLSSRTQKQVSRIKSTSCVLQDGQLDQNIGRMRYQTMDLLIKMSRLLQHKKLGTTFLVVNFHHVCMVRCFMPLLSAVHHQHLCEMHAASALQARMLF